MPETPEFEGPEFEGPIVVAEEYFHISNGGVSLKVLDTMFGPTLEIRSSLFGNNVQEQRVMLSPHGIALLARMFERASQYPFQGKLYVHYAQSSNESVKTDLSQFYNKAGELTEIKPQQYGSGSVGGMAWSGLKIIERDENADDYDAPQSAVPDEQGAEKTAEGEGS